MGVVKNMPNFDNDMVKYTEEFLSRHKRNSNKTFDNYYRILTAFFKSEFGHPNLSWVTKHDIETLHVDTIIDYSSKLIDKKNEDGTKHYKNNTINQIQAAIRSYIRFLVGREVINYNLVSLDSLEKFKDDSEEIEMIPIDIAIEYANYALLNERNGLIKSLMIETALETALRADELLELEWGQFIVVEDGVIIKSSGTNKGKGNADYIDKIEYAFYEKLLALKTGSDTDKVFQLKYRTVANTMTRLNKAFDNEGKNYSFHSLKKTCITELYIHTRCIYTCQQKARHKDINTTRRYLKLVDTAITGIMSRMMTEKEEVYKDVEKDVLLNCVEQLPREMKVLLNRYVHEHLDRNVSN